MRSTAVLILLAACGDAFQSAKPVEDAGTTVDAAVEDTWAPIVDASSEEASTVTPDSPPDAPPVAFSCKTPPQGTLLCADFDRVVAPKEGWNGEIAYGGGATAFDNSSFVSSPRSLLCSVPIQSGAAGASLSKTFTSIATTLILAFDVAVKKADGNDTGVRTLARIELNPATSGALFFDVQLRGAALAVSVAPAGGSDKVFDLAQVAVTGRWQRIRMEIDRAAVSRLRAFVDQRKAVDTQLDDVLTPAGEFAAHAGLIYVEPPTTSMSVLYDDILVAAR